MAGPATAVLMIPRMLDWPVGGGMFWLNGTLLIYSLYDCRCTMLLEQALNQLTFHSPLGSDAQLWPSSLDAEYVSSEWDCTSSEAQLLDPKCPSAGFLPLYQHFYMWWNAAQQKRIQVPLQDYSIRKMMYGIEDFKPDLLTVTSTTHSATAMLQDAMRDLYLSALIYLKHIKPYKPPGPNYLDVAESMRFEVQTQAPVVRASCVDNGNVAVVEQSMVMTFHAPRGPQSDYETYASYDESRYVVDVTEATRDYLLSRGVLVSSSPPTWANATPPPVLAIPLTLPQNITQAFGLLVLKKLDLDNNGSNDGVWNATACTIYTQWEPMTSVILSTEDNNRLEHNFVTDRIVNIVETTPANNDNPYSTKTIQIAPS